MAKDNTADVEWPPAGDFSWHPTRRLLRRLARIRLLQGRIDIRADRRLYSMIGDQPGPTVEVRLHRPLRLIARTLFGGDMGFARGYFAGDWDTSDLQDLMYLFAVNEPAIASLETGSWLHRLRVRLHHQRHANTRRGSRHNISYHYDLGNDFYRLWLDPTMTYSSGLFTTGTESLEQAQRNKNQRLLDLLEARPGQRILEIGCGWGGFAEQAAAAGLQVTGITLSEEQLAWARERAERAGLAEQVSLRLQDYRDLDGTYDHIVSIEMFEAVGEAYWDQYMQTLRRCLRPGGRAALQVITIDEPTFVYYRDRPDFIQRYIFPGGMLPTPERFAQAARRAGLEVTAQSFHGADYACTLATWHQTFDERLAEIRALGYDEPFIRLWRYYLAYCEAGFRDGRIDLMQVRLERAGV
ncbi:class I SAM-dependent methyltransferase [Thioalkalicoccus limnaeus]